MTKSTSNHKQASFLFALLCLMALLLIGCEAIPSRPATPPSVSDTPQRGASPTITDQSQVQSWHEAPPCKNQPQDLAAWRSDIADYGQNEATARQFQAYLNQLRQYTPLFIDVSLDELAASLAISDSASEEDLRQRALTVLWLNLISERLNRGSEITTDTTGTITVAELMQEVDQVQPGTADYDQLLALVDEVNAGQQISRAICSRLVYRRGPVIRESIWSDAGPLEKDYDLPDVPSGITTFSPNHTHLVVETGRNDSGGGPLYLVNLENGELLNLSEHVGLPNYTGVSSLKVNAWHYDNHHLLLINEDDEVTIWLDLNSGEYTPLNLGIDLHEMMPPREFEFSPDGTGFTFITFNPETKHTNLHWYSLADNEASLLTTLPVTPGKLRGFSFSPISQQAVYIVDTGKRAEGRSQELHLIDLESGESRILFRGNLGRTQPVWSPDGQYIAFIRKNSEQPELAGPDTYRSSGDIWIISTASGELEQLTFLNAIRQAPVWSASGQFLAFVTADGQLGQLTVAEPGQIWRVENDPIRPQHIEFSFVP